MGAALLGLIRGRVGVPEEGVAVSAVTRADADTDAGHHVHPVPGEVERYGERSKCASPGSKISASYISAVSGQSIGVAPPCRNA